MALLEHVLDKHSSARTFQEIADGPISALSGVSDRQAKHLKAALGVRTVRELATHPLILMAQSIVQLAELENRGIDSAQMRDLSRLLPRSEIDRILNRYPTIASLAGSAGALPQPLSWSEMRRIAHEDHLAGTSE